MNERRLQLYSISASDWNKILGEADAKFHAIKGTGAGMISRSGRVVAIHVIEADDKEIREGVFSLG